MSDVLRDLHEGAKKVGDLLAAVYDARQEIKTMRALLERQWQADAALYSLPHDCERHEHERWLTEHDAAHKAVGDFLGHNAGNEGPGAKRTVPLD